MILLILLLLGGSNANYRSPIQEVAVFEQKEELEEVQRNRLGHTAKISWYGNEYCEKYNPACGQACGGTFDESNFTAACASKYDCGDRLRVTYGDREVIITCTDRGSFEEKYSRELDLSKGAFEALAPLSKGILTVEVEEL